MNDKERNATAANSTLQRLVSGDVFELGDLMALNPATNHVFKYDAGNTPTSYRVIGAAARHIAHGAAVAYNPLANTLDVLVQTGEPQPPNSVAERPLDALSKEPIRELPWPTVEPELFEPMPRRNLHAQSGYQARHSIGQTPVGRLADMVGIVLGANDNLPVLPLMSADADNAAIIFSVESGAYACVRLSVEGGQAWLSLLVFNNGHAQPPSELWRVTLPDFVEKAAYALALGKREPADAKRNLEQLMRTADEAHTRICDIFNDLDNLLAVKEAVGQKE